VSAAASAPLRAPEDAAARRRALDPTASFIVQAPAGSGKTTLLVQRFLALLEQVEQPEAIVAITFTRKAAAEMRTRIIAALEQAPAVLDRDREFGWNLRSNPARLRIQTIDSLCASIVQRMPWMSRIGGMPGIVEDARELYREAAQHTLNHVTQRGAAGRAAERLLLHLDNNYRIVQAMFEDLLAKRDQWLRHVGVGAGGPSLRAALEESLAGVVTRGVEKVAARIPPLVLSRMVALHNFAGQKPPLASVPLASPDDLPTWRSLADLLLTSADTWRKTVNASHGFPPQRKAEKREFLDLVNALAQDEEMLPALVELRRLPDVRFAEEQWQLLESLLTLLPVAAAELKLTFRERGMVDFVELGEAARAALGPPERPSDLALSLGERVQHLLIDEFQDTSVSQFDLIQRLVAGWDSSDSRTLFLVGDPMQSIYRFREAEVGLFLRARSEGVGAVGCEPLQLTSNFRSRPGVVDWVNAAFAQIFPQLEDPVLGAVTYAASSAARMPDTASGVTMRAYFTPAEQPEAEEVARLAEAALPGSVAVLVRARSHANAIAAELARRHIPFRAVEFDPLTERPIIQDLQALTRALLHPGDRTAWLSVLRSPWCGLTLAELHDVASPGLTGILWDRLAASNLPRVQRLREALAGPLAQARRAPLRQCVETAWLRLGGQESGDSTRFFDLLDEIDDGGETDFALLERRIAQLFSLPPPAAGPAVELMTVHKAKGLEWDTVIVPGLGREAAADPKPLLRWSEVPMPDGSTRLILAPIEATREEQDDPIFAYLARMERQRTRFETARLLYVAATRTRERLHLLGHAEPNAKGEVKPRPGTLLHLLWPVVQEHFADGGTPAPVAAELPPLNQTIRRLAEHWQPPQDQPAPPWEPRDTEETEVTFDWAGDTLRHAGTITHRWLERMAREGPGEAPSASAIRNALEGLGLSGADLNGAAGLVEQALSRTLADDRGRWLLAPHIESATELEVSIVDEGTIRHCSIDRTFVDEQGTRWIVDYKTGVHEGKDVEAFLDRERERYRARMNLYARYFRATEKRPIRLALYYPLLSGWRTWPPD
jgi:ATP-dependent exoDNAse (exonuclease V) beta subunit